MSKPRWEVRGPGDATYGPLTFKQIRAGARVGAIGRRTLVRPAGSDAQWSAARDVAELRGAMPGSRFVLDYFLLLFVGLPLLLAAGLFHWMEVTAEGNAVRTVGEVVEVTRKSVGSEGQWDRFTPIIRYAAEDGSTFQVRAQLSGDSETWAVGQKVDVYYDPDSPEDGWLASWSGWKIAKVAALPSAVVILLLQARGLAGRARRRRRWLEDASSSARGRG